MTRFLTIEAHSTRSTLGMISPTPNTFWMRASIPISMSFVNPGYVIEVRDGKNVEVDRIIRDCKLELGTSLFTIGLIPLGHGSFDVIVGMDWLSEHKAEIVCHEKVVRIPLESGEILYVKGERTPGIAKALNLVPGATLVAKSPYRLAPLEMQELFGQFQELQDKVYLKSKDEYVVHLRLVLELLKKEELYAKLSKYHKSLQHIFDQKELNMRQRRQSIKGLSGLLQQPEIPEWKWDKITMDFITKLPKIKSRHDTIWVIVDRLTKLAHFLATREDYSTRRLAMLYIDEIVAQHGVPVSIILDQDGCVMRFGKKGKLAPRYVGPFEILERICPVAYRLRLPRELSVVRDTFHVSYLKRCLADANLHVSLDEIKIDKTLCFVEEPVEIMDREVKTLKRSKILIVKVR
nr:hypothetical protein [Tanacetum cinerariifolium]